jgi:ectoine hydroxylase-related dioxygenase (phytanoyl-CoA dioxygenase family)
LTEAVGLHHFPATADPAEVSAHLHQFGYAIIDNVVTDDVMDAFAIEVAPFVEASSAGRDEYNGRFTKRTGALIARCPTARELVMHPTVVATVRQFLSHVTAVQLHLTQLITISRGETAQKLHRDQMAFDFYPFPPSYHVQCNTMWALTDFTDANGATQVLPGSSSWPDDAPFDASDVLQAEMTRGSVLLYDGKVLHGGGANRSTSDRQGINITYSVGWVRQEENQFLAVPPELARNLDDDLLKMMGYQQGAFALGYVGDLQDPLAHLRGEHGDALLIGEVAEVSADARAFTADLPRRSPRSAPHGS